jgi:D-apiose dehydrogenase
LTGPRIALIGCGFFARNHMHAWADVGAQVVAVCDTDPARAREFAQVFNVPASFEDAAQMLAQGSIDVVDIVTTVQSHRALVELAAGIPVVVCQKPFAATLVDAQAMVAICKAKGSTLLVHENFRWQKPFRALSAASPQVGTPQFLRLSFRHGHDIYANQPYLAEVPDLALTDVGLHLFDLARFLLGDVRTVHCLTQRLNPDVAGQDAFLASLVHTSGAISSVECSFYTRRQPDPFPQTLALLEGDKGTVDLTQGYQLICPGPVNQDVEPAVPQWGAKPWHGIQDSVLAFQSHVLDVLAGRSVPRPSGSDNIRTLAVTLAAIRSARTGKAEAPWESDVHDAD